MEDLPGKRKKKEGKEDDVSMYEMPKPCAPLACKIQVCLDRFLFSFSFFYFSFFFSSVYLSRNIHHYHHHHHPKRNHFKEEKCQKEIDALAACYERHGKKHSKR